MIDLKNDEIFMKLWKIKLPYSSSYFSFSPSKTPEIYFNEHEFTDYCKYIIERALDVSLQNDMPQYRLNGTTRDIRCIFSCCMGKLDNDKTNNIPDAPEDVNLKYAAILRDERGFYSILFMCTGQIFIGAVCRENKSMSISYDVQKIMRKYFRTMPAQRKCLMKLSGIDCVKEVFDL